MIYKEEGFTLVELAIAVALTAMITAAVYAVYTRATISMNNSALKSKDRQTTEHASNLMARDIREIENSSDLESITYANSARIIFYSDYDNDDAPEKIEYSLESQILLRKITQPDAGGPPYTYTGAQQTTTVVEDIINSQMFGYYSAYDTELTSLPLNSTDREEVKFINIILSVDSSGTDNPPPTSIDINVNLRNKRE